MSWWTENRKKLLPAAGLLALQFVPGVGQAVSGALGGLTGGILGGGGGAAAGAGGLLDAAATGATAAAVPGLSATGAGSQAAMLASQNAGFGLTGLAKTAEAAAGAQGVGQGASMGAKMLGMADKGLDMAAGMQPLMGAMGGGQGQPMPPPPPPPQAGPAQPGPSFGGYQGPGMNTQPGMAFLDPEMRRKLMMMQRGGYYG